MDSVLKTILNELGIPKYFPDYNRDLFTMAFIPSDDIFNNKRHMLTTVVPFFTRINYQSLEFYGDRLLEIIITSIFREHVGVRATPHSLTTVKSYWTSNERLRKLSHDHRVCDRLFNIKRNKPLKKHNFCSDTMEALLGAIFIQYGYNETVQKWFVDTFPEVLNGVRKDIAPYYFIPAIFEKDLKNTIAKFHALNPRVRVEVTSKVNTKSTAPTDEILKGTVFIDGLKYDSGIIDKIIPIIRNYLPKKYIYDKWYSNPAYNVVSQQKNIERKHVCGQDLVYMCDGNFNRISAVNPNITTCWPRPASGPCNIITDKIPVKAMSESCKLPPYKYVCDQGVRIGRKSINNTDCPLIPLGEMDDDNCAMNDTYIGATIDEVMDTPYTYHCEYKDGDLLRTHKYNASGKKLNLNKYDKRKCNLVTDKVAPKEFNKMVRG